MKKSLKIFLIGIVLSLLIAFAGVGAKFNYDFMTVFGLINLLLGGFGSVIGFIRWLITKSETAKHFLVAAGLLLLVGAGACTAFPINLNVH